ncbi:Protein DEL-7, partial [Aphelenchoides avenae]
MFSSCHYGSISLNCCQMFQPMYVALRGRCFRLKKLAQRDLGDAGWLNVALKQLKSPYYSANKLLNQYVLHISDPYPDVRLFPRFYVNRNNYLRLTLDMVRYRLLPGNAYCSTAKEDQGLGTCQIGSWLHSRVTQSLGCTLFYMLLKTPNLTVCLPEIVVSNYFSVTATSKSEQLRTTKISDVQ